MSVTLLGYYSGSKAAAESTYYNVSTDANGVFDDAVGSGLNPRISRNGRYVVFDSGSSQLVPNDTNNRDDIFRKDTQTGEVVRVTISPTGGQETDGIDHPHFSMSADGNKVLFSAQFNGVTLPGLLWLRDIAAGTTTQVGLSTLGELPNSSIEASFLSPDGNFIIFGSSATNLDASTTTHIRRVYMRDLSTNITSLLPLAMPGGTEVYPQAVSENGRYVVYQLQYGLNGYFTHQDLYRYDRTDGTALRVDESANGQVADHPINSDAVITPDGRYVAFYSGATNLTSDPTNQTFNVFVKDMANGLVRMASVSVDGSAPNGGSHTPSISDNGRYVSFDSSATNLTPIPDAQGVRRVIYARDMQTQRTMRVSQIGINDDVYQNDIYGGDMVSGDGRYVALITAFKIYRANIGLFAPTATADECPSRSGVLEWQRVPGADHYDVYRVGTPDKIGTVSGDTYGTFYVDRPITEGIHQYYVAAALGTEVGPASNVVSCTVDQTPPTVSDPQFGKNPIAVGQTTTLSVNIQDNVGPINDAFVIITPTGADPIYDQLTFNASTGRWETTVGSGLQAGTYDVTVYAIDSIGASNETFYNVPSQLVVAPAAPTVPTGLAAATPTKLPSLNWQPVINADHYDIYRDGSKIGTSSTTSYPDNSAAEGSHSYTVKAVDATGAASDPSASFSVLVDKTGPAITNVGWSANPLLQGQNTTLSVTATDTLTSVNSVSYTLDNGPAQAMTFDTASNTWKATLGNNLPVNTYPIAVTATDTVTNSSSPYFDVLVVSNPANGSVSGREKFIPSATDTLPIVRDTAAHNPTEITVGFTNVQATGTAPASGSIDMSYIIKNKKDSFEFSSTAIDWLVIPDATHASILSHGVLTTYVNGSATVVQGMALRIDVTLGANGNSDHVTVKIYGPGVNPNTGTPLYNISDDIPSNGSKAKIKK